VKRAVIDALLSGDFQFAARRDLPLKNLLAMGMVSPTFVADIIRSSRGGDYACSPLHGKHTIDCHLIRSQGWYIKVYFLEPDTWFVSVHK